MGTGLNVVTCPECGERVALEVRREWYDDLARADFYGADCACGRQLVDVHLSGEFSVVASCVRVLGRGWSMTG